MNAYSPPDTSLQPGETIGEFMEGRLRVIQSKKGYRFSLDAVLLTRFVTVRAGDILVDLGTGCGIISLILLMTKPLGYALGLEIQPELASQAVRNALLNRLDHKMGVIVGDLRHPPISPSRAHVLVCNPPYRPERSGRINPDNQRAIARHEILASVNCILDAARDLLRPRGRLAIIYPAERLADVLVRMRGFDLEPKRLQVVHPDIGSEAKLVLIEAVSGGKAGVKVLPPVIARQNEIRLSGL
jgi:tRNA1Val (adenine37-N6)-methyltransferase